MITFTPAFVLKASLHHEKDHGWDHEQARRHKEEPPSRHIPVDLYRVGRGPGAFRFDAQIVVACGNRRKECFVGTAAFGPCAVGVGPGVIRDLASEVVGRAGIVIDEGMLR